MIKNMNIAIWGAGKFGQYVHSQLEANDKIEVICFIDSSVGEDDERKFKGIDIVNPLDYMVKYAAKTDAVLVAFAGSITILDQLQKLGIKRYGFIYRRVLTYRLPFNHILENDINIIWNDDEELKKVCMNTLETNVVDYCNLNCKGCSHFSNLFPKGSQVPFQTFEQDIKQLSTKVFISQFNLLGGEVFLSDKLPDYIACLKKYMPKTKIELISNGMLIPHLKKELLQYIKENKVMINITEYPPQVNGITQRIKDTLEQYQISYLFRPLVKTFGKNIDISGKNDPTVAMRSCRESKCQFLRDGKLYKCPFSVLGNFFFEHYNIPICFHEGIDIYDKELDWKKEIGKLCNEPIDACRYCGTEERFSWERSDTPIKEEWLI